MLEYYMNKEVNESKDSVEKEETMDSDFEAELDSKFEEYITGGRSLEDIQRDKEELLQMRAELMKYQESQEGESSEEEDNPEKLLKLTKHR